MRALQRIAAICIIVALSALLFYTGRAHQIFLDNKTIEVEGQSFRALKFVRITIEPNFAKNAAPIELMPRDRDLARVKGPSFRLKVEVMDEFGEEVESVIEKDMYLGFTKDIMLSMPLLAEGRDDYILPPPTIAAPADPVDSEGLPSIDGLEIDISLTP